MLLWLALFYKNNQILKLEKLVELFDSDFFYIIF
jgi:hypothetical protein